MEKLELELTDLLLDLNNPRIGQVATQAEALSAIIDLDSRHFKTMMESIKTHGLDPGDAFYILGEEGNEDYVVVDGNRRLAALKVLNEPNILQSTTITSSVQAKLVKAAEGFDRKLVSTVSCVLFDDRATADEWILRRHGRGMEGEARIPWGSLEIQRFQKDQTVLDVIDFVGKNSTFTDDRWSQIKSAVENKPSVLKRMVDSKPLKTLLGLSVTEVDGERLPSFTADPGTALNVLSKIFEDISNGELDTRTINKADDIKVYIEDLNVPPKKGKTTSAQKFRDTEIKDKETRPRQAMAKATPAVVKKSSVKPPRPTLAPKKHPFQQPLSAKGQRLLYEASNLKLKEMPLSSAFILRAFIEHTIEVYMSANNMPFVDPKGNNIDLKHRAENVIQHMVQSKAAKTEDLRGARRTLTGTTDPASIQALNDYHHNKFHIPTGDALRAAWDSAEAIYIAVYGSVK
ncbi:hypothetical protein [Agrobacterium tumefaciens]|uniref:hypothetical protein n=1 Tax=Agrobacterium tumefaciens TaxID=358 RepID=UPI001574BC98|nr:hypothetical protein [Agrobacterium tumefaciens]